MALEIGDAFPSFFLTDQGGRQWSEKDLLGAWIVLYFYPKDDTSGCTLEACEFRDRLPRFGSARVLGISPDSVKSHQKFAEKFGLPFPLLADEGHRLAEACGIWVEKTLYGKKYMGVERTTYLIDPEGRIAQIWRKVNPEGHAEQVLAAMPSAS